MNIEKLNDDRINKVMVNILLNKGFDHHWLDEFNTLSELESVLNNLVRNYKETSEERLKVFHLIQLWGGITGRNIYVMSNGGFSWKDIDNHYKSFVDSCLSIKGHTNADFDAAYDAMKKFNNNVKNISYSFISKQLRFWGYKNLREWTFPPYDSVMVKEYMKKKYYRHTDIIPYWQKIYKEAADYGQTVSQYERYLFNKFH